MSAIAYDYSPLADRVRRTLRAKFHVRQLKTSKGYLGRVHVMLVSEALNGLSEERKQKAVWDVLRAELGDQAQGVSLVLPYGTDEVGDSI